MMLRGVSWKRFFSDLWKEADEDNIFNGGAALAYYLTLGIFPAMLSVLAVIPYLPIDNIDQAIWDLFRQVMPGDVAKMFTGVIDEVTSNKKSGLLSLGLLGALWAAGNGTLAVMQELNVTYDVKEGRSFLKVRAIGFGLTFVVGALFVTAFALIVLGGKIQEWLLAITGDSGLVLAFFAVLRWVIIVVAALSAFASLYYFGPDVKQKFRFITPGSVIGTVLVSLSTIGFRLYVSNFADYNATYGSIGAVIVMMLWLYIIGLVILLGSEINALFEHYSAGGKSKGEKK